MKLEPFAMEPKEALETVKRLLAPKFKAHAFGTGRIGTAGAHLTKVELGTLLTVVERGLAGAKEKTTT